MSVLQDGVQRFKEALYGAVSVSGTEDGKAFWVFVGTRPTAQDAPHRSEADAADDARGLRTALAALLVPVVEDLLARAAAPAGEGGACLDGLTIGEPKLDRTLLKVPVSITRERARLVLGLDLPAGMNAAELVIELDLERLRPWYARALTSKGRRSRIEGGVVVVRTAGARPVRREPREGGAA